MNHKQFESWILDDPTLSAEEQAQLDAHLATCEDCRTLKNGWENSMKALQCVEMQKPILGFAERFEKKMAFEHRKRAIVRRRLIIIISAFALLTALTAYIFISGSLQTLLANAITFGTQILLAFTKGLSDITYFIRGIPTVIRWSAGFFLVSVANMFVALLGLIVWKARKNRQEMQKVHVHVEK